MIRCPSLVPTRSLRPRLAALAGGWLCLAATATAAAGAAQALVLDLPDAARVTAEAAQTIASYALPIGPWDDGSMITRLTEGALAETAWRVEAPGTTTLQLLQPLRAQLAAQGFRVLFECDTLACGGFDFRFSTRVLPEPDMHVDLGDFRFLAAERGEGAAAEHLSLLVSRSSAAGFVQLIRVVPDAAAATGTDVASATEVVTGADAATPAAASAPDNPPQATSPAAPTPATAAAAQAAPVGTAGAFADALENGSVALDDLDFASGAAVLDPGDYASLRALAAYLEAHPGRNIALVGHTDASGGLAGNVALSLRRAESVRDRLIRDHGVAAGRVIAQGVGYLAPRATNLTLEGRARNRRVEVMLTSTE